MIFNQLSENCELITLPFETIYHNGRQLTGKYEVYDRRFKPKRLKITVYSYVFVGLSSCVV